ncbi:DUF89 family protein [Helicobacter jaachi]|uniref:DUF89 family protein n=1 Tax=Helicobacter jaachi TaxID=1677920 RepID=A0A4U8TB42_9HELI|nr:ARMT1-like domain-containing protein [Helicobacter jaachi]TLD96904.1 DUF89 family protein [Helicobacter jaachi]
MRARQACLVCLQNQAENVCKMLHTSHAKDIAQAINKKLSHFKDAKDTAQNPNSPITQPLYPPQIAISIYAYLAAALGVEDPFLHIKQESMVRANAIINNLLARYSPPELKYIESSTESQAQYSLDSITQRLDWAVRMAILGNVIDYGSQSAFSFEHADFGFESMQFGIFDIQAFAKALDSAQSLLYLADNAGENIFDKVLIHTLKIIYPNLRIYYALRGRAIINDLTLADMAHPLAQDMQKFCTLLDSGVRSPGFVYDDANAKTRAIYDSASVILAKGMGNFECLESSKDKRLFLLFKVKCDVVAHFCGVQKGMMMFKHNV